MPGARSGGERVALSGLSGGGKSAPTIDVRIVRALARTLALEESSAAVIQLPTSPAAGGATVADAIKPVTTDGISGSERGRKW